MARAKVPSLALEPAQEQAALLLLQRFLYNLLNSH